MKNARSECCHDIILSSRIFFALCCLTSSMPPPQDRGGIDQPMENHLFRKKIGNFPFGDVGSMEITLANISAIVIPFHSNYTMFYISFIMILLPK